MTSHVLVVMSSQELTCTSQSNFPYYDITNKTVYTLKFYLRSDKILGLTD